MWDSGQAVQSVITGEISIGFHEMGSLFPSWRDGRRWS